MVLCQELNLNCHQAPQKMSFVTRNARTVILLTSSMLVCPCCEETDSNSFSLQKLNCLTPPFSLSPGRETSEMGLQGNSRVLPSTHGWSQLGNGGSGLSQFQIMQWDWGAPKLNARLLFCQTPEKWMAEAKLSSVISGHGFSVYSSPCPFQTICPMGQGTPFLKKMFCKIFNDW